MANELITREDVVRGKKNIDAIDDFISSSNPVITLPNGKKVKTRAGIESSIRSMFEPNTVGMKISGIEPGQVPLSEDVYKASNVRVDYTYTSASENVDCNNFQVGTRNLVSDQLSNTPERLGEGSYLVETRYFHPTANLQIAWGFRTGILFMRVSDNETETWTDWISASSNPLNYRTTTATAANVVVTSTGELQRSTSSRVFKDDIQPIEIEDYRAALKSVQPVSYRSKYTADNPDWTWYSFIAEDVVDVDPRLVQMSDVEFFEDTDENGNKFVNSRQLPEGEYAPSGLNFNGIVTLMARINQYMLEDIEALESEKTQLKTRMTKLENRLDALEKQLAAK